MRKNCTAVLAIVGAVALLAGALWGAFAAEKTLKIKVPGCTCGDTEVMVRNTLQQTTGVKSVETNPTLGAYIVVFDDTKTDYDQLRRALQQVGYPPVGKPEYMN